MGKIAAIAVLLIVLIVVVTPSMAFTSCTERDELGRAVTIVEPGVGRDIGLIRVIHIHYAVKPEKPSKSEAGERCFRLLGYRWTYPIVFTVNTTNDVGLAKKFVVDSIENAAAAWDGNTSAMLFKRPVEGECLLREGADGTNCTSFGDYTQSNVIAVTYTWYSRLTKTAMESDILFDTDFAWDDATRDPESMDLQNIATHEIGQTLGLGDLYTKTCNDVTMYGYSTVGETKKRTLERGDILGLQRIYGG